MISSIKNQLPVIDKKFLRKKQVLTTFVVSNAGYRRYKCIYVL